MTLDEFLAWEPCDPTGARWQLIDGEAVAMAPATEFHAAIMAEIERLIGNHLTDRNSPCRFWASPGSCPGCAPTATTGSPTWASRAPRPKTG
jgi:Uma2 family endonuclease